MNGATGVAVQGVPPKSWGLWLAEAQSWPFLKHSKGGAASSDWRQAVETEVPASPVVVLTQNPETSGTSWYREHAKRRLDLLAHARQKGLASIDTYQAFLDAGWPGALMADAVHPNDAGSLVWRDAVKAVFDAA